MKKMIPYLLINILAFYLIPLIIQDTGTAIFTLLILIPIICFITSLIYGIKNNFNILYSGLVAILFIPTIFIYYNSTASIYIIGYAIISIIGNLIGKIFYKNK